MSKNLHLLILVFSELNKALKYKNTKYNCKIICKNIRIS